MKDKSLRRFELQTVIVHSATSSVKGILTHAYRDCFVLRHARSLDQDADLAGEVVIPKSQGVWMQVIDPEVVVP